MARKPTIRTSTVPRQPSNSGKAQLQRRLSGVIASAPAHRYWGNGLFAPNLDLLGQLLSFTDPKNTTGGSVAAAVDMWVGEQLRAAGFSHVLPRQTEPYYVGAAAEKCYEEDYFSIIDSSLLDLQASIEQLKSVAATLQGPASGVVRNNARALESARSRLTANIRRVRGQIERSTSTLLGEGRHKQVDVFIAEWDRGLELAVSTKTLALGVEKIGELGKNVPNRWEEVVGDLGNLRGRFPLAAIGALLLVPASTLGSSVIFDAADMMRKLTAPGRDWVNAYDATTIIVVSNLTPNRSTSEQVTADDNLPAEIREDLLTGRFFNRLIDRVLERSPISEHTRVRELRAEARGESTEVYAEAAAISDGIEESPEVDADGRA